MTNTNQKQLDKTLWRIATRRRWALNLIKADLQESKRSLKGRMKAAGWGITASSTSPAFI
jgi:hypothetical protein